MLQREYEAGSRNLHLSGKLIFNKHKLSMKYFIVCKISGDSGYGQQPWLFVPITETESEAENKYNSSHLLWKDVLEYWKADLDV